MSDIRKHVVQGNPKRDDHKDVSEEREWYEVFELTKLTRNDKRAKDEQHVPEYTQLMVRKVIIHQLEQTMDDLKII